MALPNLTPEQRAAALAKAKRMRSERAALLAKIKSGEVDPMVVLMRRDQVVTRMYVSAFIKSWPNFGPAKTAHLMAELGIAKGRRIGGLRCRQRDALIDAASRTDYKGKD